MPQLTKLYTVEITPEQFVKACSDIELQELDLNISGELRRRSKTAIKSLEVETHRVKAWKKFFNSLEYTKIDTILMDTDINEPNRENIIRSCFDAGYNSK